MNKEIVLKYQIYKAIENRKFYPHFQKIIGENDLFFECLSRIEGDEDIAPTVFIPILEEIGLYKQFTFIMLEKSFEYFKNRIYDFSINLSYEDIADLDFLEKFIKLVEEYQIARQLIVEIAEKEIEDYSVIMSFKKKIKELGCRIAIDDFGAGYSNLMSVMLIEPDILKFDGKLVKTVNLGFGKTFVQHLVTVLKQMNIKTVAEFVSDREIYTTLKDMGVDMFQGYYIAKPIKEIKETKQYTNTKQMEMEILCAVK